MNLEKYAKLLMIISRDTPMYWPETIEMVLKSLLAKKAIKTNIPPDWLQRLLLWLLVEL